jgi:quercetin dioxygenase-like cupin family protein
MKNANEIVPEPCRGVLLGPEEGECFNIIGGGVRILMDGAATGGRCVIFEAPIPAGDGPPLHRHAREDELFFVLEGTFKFQVDGKVFIGEKGAFAAAPRGSVHAFRNIGKSEGRMLITCTPAGLEAPFRAVKIPEGGKGMSVEELMAEFGKYGVTFLGPPLGD